MIYEPKLTITIDIWYCYFLGMDYSVDLINMFISYEVIVIVYVS